MRRCTRRYSSPRDEFHRERIGSGRAVSRFLSAFLRTERIICLSSQYPKPVHFRGRGTSRSSVSYLALHPMGFSVPRRLRFARWALTPPFHPYQSEISDLKSEISKWRYLLCGTVRRDDSRRRRPRVSQPNEPELRGIAPCGVRTFLPRLAPKAILRPSRTSERICQNTVALKSRNSTPHFANEPIKALGKDQRSALLSPY